MYMLELLGSVVAVHLRKRILGESDEPFPKGRVPTNFFSFVVCIRLAAKYVPVP